MDTFTPASAHTLIQRQLSSQTEKAHQPLPGPVPSPCPAPTHQSQSPAESQDAFTPGLQADEVSRRQQQLRDLARGKGLDSLHPVDKRRYFATVHAQNPGSMQRLAHGNDASVAPHKHQPGAVETAQSYYQQQINGGNPYASIPQSLVHLSGLPQSEASLQESGYQSGLGTKANKDIAHTTHIEAALKTMLAVGGMVPPIGGAGTTARCLNLGTHVPEVVDGSRAVAEVLPEATHGSPASTSGIADTAADHMWTQTPTIGRRTKGINGGHNADEFAKALHGQGEVSATRSVPGLDGVSQIEYRMYKEESGVITNHLQSGRSLVKTVFDPKKWDRDKIAALGNSVFKGCVTDGTHTIVKDGVNFTGWIRQGTLQSFGVEL